MVVKIDILKWKGFKEYNMPYENLEDHLNIKEILMKKRLGESPEDYINLYDELTKKKHYEESPNDYKDTFSEMKEKLNNKDSVTDSLVSVTPDVITISTMKINYSRENLNKVLDFINDITEGATKL